MFKINWELLSNGENPMVKVKIASSNFEVEGVSTDKSFWKARIKALYEAIELAELLGYGSAVAPLRAWIQSRTNRNNQNAQPQQYYQPQQPSYQPQPSYAPPQYPAPTPTPTPAPNPAPQQKQPQPPQGGGDEEDPFATLFG